MKLYDSYLFDADGTLFDTVELICTCFQYVAEKYAGKTMDRRDIIHGIGLPLKSQLITHLGPELDHEHILDDYLQYQLSIMQDSIRLFPHVIETLALLKSAGKKLAIVTSRRRFSLEKILQSTDTAGYFDVLVTPEDTARHKPDAEPALKAMSLLGAEKTSSVFIGDALYDICSGASAGIDTIFVNWSHAARSSLPVAPTWAINSLQELTLSLHCRKTDTV
ncbi:HAD family hydrolase [Desulfopila sp. IMCC35006]|uniref:HAD family hydrolase n=1 Tax=Desulfopila sp. IMCC35006 TaxID=2569542 RepID=UPI0010AD4FF0|nr:HAD hydrolase-like protein [Desulfopila sp. IMCC35006]TKB27110.1 HAD family hydrolase [Desulfopila sp. IMCC35006]